MSLLFNNFPFIKYRNSKSRGFSSQSFPRTLLLSALAFALIVSLAAILVSQKPEYTPTTRALTLSSGVPKVFKLQRFARGSVCGREAYQSTKRHKGNKAARLHRLACQKTKVGIGIRGNKVVLALKLPPTLQKNTTITAALKTGSSRRSPKRLTKARGKAGKQGWFRAVYRLDKNTRRFRLTGRIRINLSSSSRSTSLFLPLLPSALAQTNNPQRLVLPFVIVGRVKGGGVKRAELVFTLASPKEYVGERVNVTIVETPNNSGKEKCEFEWKAGKGQYADRWIRSEVVTSCREEVDAVVDERYSPWGWVPVFVKVNPEREDLVKSAYLVINGVEVRWSDREGRRKEGGETIEVRKIIRGEEGVVLGVEAWVWAKVLGVEAWVRGDTSREVSVEWRHEAYQDAILFFEGIWGETQFIGSPLTVQGVWLTEGDGLVLKHKVCRFAFYKSSEEGEEGEYKLIKVRQVIGCARRFALKPGNRFTVSVEDVEPNLLKSSDWEAGPGLKIVEEIPEEKPTSVVVEVDEVTEETIELMDMFFDNPVLRRTWIKWTFEAEAEQSNLKTFTVEVEGPGKVRATVTRAQDPNFLKIFTCPDDKNSQTCSIEVPPPYNVHLYAMPDSNARFEGWEEGCKSEEVSGNICYLSGLNKNHKVRAIFRPAGNGDNGSTPPPDGGYGGGGWNNGGSGGSTPSPDYPR
jgi:hypothetical protein